jgi:hypothetical protein
VHRKLAEVLDEVTAELERIDSEVCSAARDKGWDDFTVCLDNLAQRYTMESERLIHASVAGVLTAGASVGDAGGEDASELSHLLADAAAESEFGDNVELF